MNKKIAITIHITKFPIELKNLINDKYQPEKKTK